MKNDTRKMTKYSIMIAADVEFAHEAAQFEPKINTLLDNYGWFDWCVKYGLCYGWSNYESHYYDYSFTLYAPKGTDKHKALKIFNEIFDFECVPCAVTDISDPITMEDIAKEAMESLMEEEGEDGKVQ